MKGRAASRVGMSVHKAEVLTFTDEDSLWFLLLFGTHSLDVLMHTVVFSIILRCSLRAGKDYRSL